MDTNGIAMFCYFLALAALGRRTYSPSQNAHQYINTEIGLQSSPPALVISPLQWSPHDYENHVLPFTTTGKWITSTLASHDDLDLLPASRPPGLSDVQYADLDLIRRDSSNTDGIPDDED